MHIYWPFNLLKTNIKRWYLHLSLQVVCSFWKVLSATSLFLFHCFLALSFNKKRLFKGPSSTSRSTPCCWPRLLDAVFLNKEREMTSDTINWLVVGANMLCVDTLMILSLYYGRTLVPVKDVCVLFRAPHPGCPEAFLEPCRVGKKKNETLNTGNTNLLVNFAEKQIGLHNHKRSGTKGPLSCIAALVSCFIKT